MARLKGPRRKPTWEGCAAEGKENSANFANQQGQKKNLRTEHARAEGLPATWCYGGVIMQEMPSSAIRMQGTLSFR